MALQSSAPEVSNPSRGKIKITYNLILVILSAYSDINVKVHAVKIPKKQWISYPSPHDYSDLLIEKLPTLKNYCTYDINVSFSFCCSKRWAI